MLWVSGCSWKVIGGYLRTSLCSRAFNEANVKNSGVKLNPGNVFTQTVDADIHLSMAALETREGYEKEFSGNAQVIVHTERGRFVVCTLKHGFILQQNLDMHIRAKETVTLSCEGKGVIYLTGHTLNDTNKHRRNALTEAVHDSITSYLAAGKDDSDSEEDSREEEEEEDCWRAVFNPDIIATAVTIKQEPPDSDDDQQAGVVRNTEGIQPTDHNTSIVVHIGNTEKSGETLIDPVETGKGTQESQNNGRGQKANTDSLKRSSAPLKSSEKKKLQLKGKVTKENKKDSESFLGDFFPCATCGKTFQSKTALSRHQQSHSEDRPHKCSWCGKGFKVLSSLQAHHRVHTGEKPFECKVCYKAFGDIGSCRRHEKTHDPQTPFQCEYCGKGFAENSQLTRHIRIHTGEKPYPCGTCEKRFSDKGQLKRHERRHLKGQERAAYNGQCDVCGKVLQDASSLKRHSLLHTNEKPYTCQLCGKAFRERSTLRQHGRMHDRLDKDVISCVNCGKGFKNIQTFNDHTIKCNNSSLDQSVSLEIENVALNPVIKEEV